MMLTKIWCCQRYDAGNDFDDENAENSDTDYESDLQWGVAMAASTGREWEQNMKRCKNDQCAIKFAKYMKDKQCVKENQY